MTALSKPNSQRIRKLNDSFRRTFTGGRVLVTEGSQRIKRGGQSGSIEPACASFDRFDRDNDPHGEHDFGSFEVEGKRFFFKIDYYDLEMDGGSEDPADPAKTTRVLTVMKAEEY